jgi:RNA polymerase sigma-32 factor
MSPEQVREIATKLAVSEEDVIQMNRRLAGPDRSLNTPLHEDGAGEWQDWISDDRQTHDVDLAERDELQARRELLNRALKTLNARERRILEARRLQDQPLTLEELSKEYGVSRERIRQVEVRAFEKLQTAIRDFAKKERLDDNLTVPAA